MDNERLWLLKNSMLYEMAIHQPNYKGSFAQKLNDTSFSMMEHNIAIQQDEINEIAQEPNMIVNIVKGK